MILMINNFAVLSAPIFLAFLGIWLDLSMHVTAQICFPSVQSI